MLVCWSKRSDQARLQRAGRYLKGHLSYHQLHRWQPDATQATLQIDSDWTMCKDTCRSNGGGILFLESHPVSPWWLPYGEAELYSSVHGQGGDSIVNLLRERFGHHPARGRCQSLQEHRVAQRSRIVFSIYGSDICAVGCAGILHHSAQDLT